MPNGETTSVPPVTTYETVYGVFLDFGMCILDKKLCERQIGFLTVIRYFMAYVNFCPYLPHFFLSRSLLRSGIGDPTSCPWAAEFREILYRGSHSLHKSESDPPHPTISTFSFIFYKIRCRCPQKCNAVRKAALRDVNECISVFAISSG